MISRLQRIEQLEQANALTERDAERVARALSQSTEPVDIIITRLGILADADIARAYASAANAPLDLAPTASNSVCALQSQINSSFLRSRRVAPIDLSEDAVTVCMADPFDQDALLGIEFAFDRPASVRVTTSRLIDELLIGLETNEESERDHDDLAIDHTDADLLRDLASAEPSIRVVQTLIAEAGNARASDIHIETSNSRYQVRHRIDGILQDAGTLSKTAGLRAISRLKILSDLDIAEQRRPQDGRASFALDGRVIDLRLATTPTTDGENLVVRLLDRDSHALDLASLGFACDDVELLRRLIQQPNGMIILTGPTGSGKTTTLYALLSMLADGRRKILTVEDPVEYKLDGVNQTQVNPAINLTFANGLRAFLRQDPDVVMVGEIRDLETAQIAMRAALTGHLVLSTLHTNTAATAITRLKDMGVESYLIASTMLGVVGQRLVRRICDACHGETVDADGAPCKSCGGSGYRGRLVVAECLEVDDRMRALIKANESDAAIAAAHERPSMHEDGAQKAHAGLTRLDEVERACGK